MERAIDGGTLRDNLTDIYGDGNRLVYLNDVLDLIDEQPTLTPPNEWVSVEELREMDGEAIYWPKNKMWLIVYLNHPDFGDCAVNRYGQYLKLENCEKRKVYRRPPDGL